MEAQFLRDFARDGILNQQDVRELSVILFAPYLLPVFRVYQLRLYIQSVAAFDDSAHQNRADLQLAPEVLRINLLAFVTEYGAARQHLQLRQLRKAVDDVFGHAVTKILGLGIR